ncbi:hypothetical protein EDEG_00262 [Edhazardia aedis USNM 41457]|uniref:Uncharacterized protein n=1 Tax=Edhazardia aedis (strain USNM 41457) TaxID=1003232 RepID=J8ZSI6_EDHAE|nr:hypothetical protein EDEG_00262 [Edhazardia aedis USNM 41457]|eukprot:EJW02608.1 hypothetical protein EDEG_00262 [Edhazardia aedis USNM 41457]
MPSFHLLLMIVYVSLVINNSTKKQNSSQIDKTEKSYQEYKCNSSEIKYSETEKDDNEFLVKNNFFDIKEFEAMSRDQKVMTLENLIVKLRYEMNMFNEAVYNLPVTVEVTNIHQKVRETLKLQKKIWGLLISVCEMLIHSDGKIDSIDHTFLCFEKKYLSNEFFLISNTVNSKISKIIQSEMNPCVTVKS